jgi:hypothetical protein
MPPDPSWILRLADLLLSEKQLQLSANLTVI